MTPFPHSIDLHASLAEAQAMMAAHNIRHLPVVQAGRLVGVLSERDMWRWHEEHLRVQAQDDWRVRDVCVLEAYVVDMSERLDSVLAHMAEHHIGSALITRHGKLAGIFTSTDACRAFAALLRSQFPPGHDNNAA
jgi:CBS domain-containing protein